MSYPKSIAAFLVLTFGLLGIDFVQEKGIPLNWSVASVIQGVFQKSAVTEEVLFSTSLASRSLTFLEKSELLFVPYLKLPDGVLANHWGIEGTSIRFSEVRSLRPQEVIRNLLTQTNSSYQFNQINETVFYLNQMPVSAKTHNFLAILIKDRIFGFQYHPSDHAKVLEIIDALVKTQLR